MTAVRTISAVDNTTEQLTITAHGLNTGDGFLRVYAPTGGVIPGGLAPVTDYWVIVVSANVIKLATSSANALAGTAINITSNGTLPLQLLQGVPFAVPRIAAPGTQILSQDENDTWQALVALWNLLTGQAQAIWTAITLALSVVINGDLTVTGTLHHGTITRKINATAAISVNETTGATPVGNYLAINGAWRANAVAQSLLFPLPVYGGEQIVNVRARVACGATDMIAMGVFRLTATPGSASTVTQLGTGTNSTGHAHVVETLSVNAINEATTPTDNRNYFVLLQVSAFANTPDVLGIEIDVTA